MEISRALLELEYAIDARLTVSAIFSYVDIDRKVSGATPVKEHISGLGDTLLLFKWTAWDTGPFEEEIADWLSDEPRWMLRLIGGASLPTGKTRTPGFAPAGTPQSLLQVGSGTVQPIIGAGLRVDWGGMAATLDVQTRLPFYENDNDFQEGVSFIANVGWEFRPIEELIIRLAVDMDYRKRDLQDGNRIEPGGGFHLNIHPAIVWVPSDDIQVFGGVSFPIYRNVPIRTLDPSATYELGVTIVF